jgi:predicted signal transduction protein with EAL and GGDEF domain
MVCINASIGAVSERDCDNPNNLFQYADIAAGEAKRTGCVVFSIPVSGQLTRKSILTQDLRMAIANRQLSLSPSPSYRLGSPASLF